jgi:hypothetical protein
MRYGSILICILTFYSCSRLPVNVKLSLEKAGANRPELEKVIRYYQDGKDLEKLNAAYFLIGNMGGHFGLYGDAVTIYDPIFHILDSLHEKGVKMLTESPVVKFKWDSLTRIYDQPDVRNAEKEADLSIARAAVLIEHIDGSYGLWKNSSLNKEISFDQYCEYLLPYRTGTERMIPWFNHVNKKYKLFRDTVKANNNLELVRKFDIMLRKEFSLNHTIDKYPFDMTAMQMEMARRGACRHLVNYEAMVMRANGLPVSIDFTPLWGDNNKGHEWLTLINGKQKPYAFDAVQEHFDGFHKNPYRFVKVYRRSFKKQDIILPHDISDIPVNLRDDQVMDVTKEYTQTADFKLTLQFPSPFNNRHVLLCSYGNRWTAQSWAGIQVNTAEFRSIGTNVVLMGMYSHGGKLYPATLPFILSKNGKPEFIKPHAGNQALILTRKFPSSPLNYRNAVCFLNGRIQGANKADYSDAEDLKVINTVPVAYVDIAVKPSRYFRYVRYLAARGQKNNLAELEFYTLLNEKDTTQLRGKIKGFPEISPELGTPYQNAFDGDPGSYFSGQKDSISWAGMDFGRPKLIVKVRYCPRSDTNFILIGDTYELSTWQKDKWLSVGKQKAMHQSITFNNVSQGGLYLLKDLSRGKEQRMFTYSGQKQIWW